LNELINIKEINNYLNDDLYIFDKQIFLKYLKNYLVNKNEKLNEKLLSVQDNIIKLINNIILYCE
jgi:hypothetical protein